MTRCGVGNTGLQGRRGGFEEVMKSHPEIEVLDTQPADWDVSKVARIWGTHLTQHPQIDAAFFHNDDMALAAAEVMKRQGREGILLRGVVDIPPALHPVSSRRKLSNYRTPPCSLHAHRLGRWVGRVRGGA